MCVYGGIEVYIFVDMEENVYDDLPSGRKVS